MPTTNLSECVSKRQRSFSKHAYAGPLIYIIIPFLLKLFNSELGKPLPFSSRLRI